MKVCIISICVLALIFGIAVVNGIYIEKICNELLVLEKYFPEKNGDEEKSEDPILQESLKKWEKAYNFVTITCHSESANTISLSLSHLISCYMHGSRADYLSAREAYKEALKALLNTEALSIENII